MCYHAEKCLLENITNISFRSQKIHLNFILNCPNCKLKFQILSKINTLHLNSSEMQISLRQRHYQIPILIPESGFRITMDWLLWKLRINLNLIDMLHHRTQWADSSQWYEVDWYAFDEMVVILSLIGLIFIFFGTLCKHQTFI